MFVWQGRSGFPILLGGEVSRYGSGELEKEGGGGGGNGDLLRGGCGSRECFGLSVGPGILCYESRPRSPLVKLAAAELFVFYISLFLREEDFITNYLSSVVIWTSCNIPIYKCENRESETDRGERMAGE